MKPNGFEAWILKAADRVVALSTIWADLLRKTGSRVVIIPNPVVLPNSDSAKPMASRFPTILYMGKVEPRKGYRELVQSMPLVLSKFPNALLRIAGHGEIVTAECLAQELGVRESIDFLGWVCNEDKVALYRSADIFCLPSFSEGVPMALLEAMSFKLAVVCTPVGGVPDLLISGRNGILVEPGNVGDIAAALIDLLEDPARRAVMGEAAFETVESTCSLEIVAQKLAMLYTDMLTSQMRSGSGFPIEVLPRR
jgi:glycosyltransferase involved in cell wall biosynthesis